MAEDLRDASGSACLVERLPNFGEIAAEKGFRPEFFVQSDSWKALRDRERCIVVGRKGTGKTAMGLALFEERLRNPRVFARQLNFAHYPWTVHDVARDATVGAKTQFVETWLFLILVELAKIAIADQGGEPSKSRAEACAELEKFITQVWGETSFDFQETFKRKEYKVAVRLDPSFAGVGLGGVDWQTVPVTTLGPKLQEMNQWLQLVLVQALETDTEYFLIFDDLDMEMDPGNSLYISSMIGLVRAAGAIDDWARDSSAGVSAVVLMRNDLYGLLQFSDKPKFDDALVERLTWTDEATGPDSLRQILNARIPVLAAVDNEAENKAHDWWSEVFSDAPVEGDKGIFDFLIERSYRRPRDLIKYCNLCLAQAQQRIERTGESAATARIEPQDVVNALPAYSLYAREEIRAESFTHHEEMNTWMELLGRIGSPVFTKTTFEGQAQQSADLIGDTGAAQLLQAFFHFSIIGCGHPAGQSDSGGYFWAYEDVPRAFNVNAPRFLVHPSLQATLGLVS